MQDSKKGCVICGKPINPTYRPFCSKRCADVDLGKWFNESYAVEGEENEDGMSSDAVDVGE
jgi:endogenous inhibitor of DNA gyrase (YacG/DUF329 family)